jgi:hypothetical protein
MTNKPITSRVQHSTKGGMVQEPLLNVGKVGGGTSSCGCGSPAKQTAKQKANLPEEIVNAIAAKESPAKNYKKGYYGA